MTQGEKRVATLGMLNQVEGSRIITFDRNEYARGPLAPFATREGVIGFNKEFEKLFGVTKADTKKHNTCGKLLKNEAGGDKVLAQIRAAMEIVDAGEPACFHARNISCNDGLQDTSVVVLPVTLVVLEEPCHMMIGFQTVDVDLQTHFENIKSIFWSEDGPGLHLLTEWAGKMIHEFVRTHPLLNETPALTLPTDETPPMETKPKDKPQGSTESTSAGETPIEDSSQYRPPTKAETIGSRSRELAVGDEVLVHGLQGAPELNGCRGKILRFVPSRNRFEVQLEGMDGTKGLKAENLIVRG